MSADDAPRAARLEDRLLPWRSVKDLTGLSRTTAWRLQKAGDFPRPLVISPGRVGWRESDIAAWTQSRSTRRPGPGAPRGPKDPAQRPRPDAAPPAARRPPPPVASPPAGPTSRADRRRSSPDQIQFDF